jgi:hypothetical protein
MDKTSLRTWTWSEHPLLTRAVLFASAAAYLYATLFRWPRTPLLLNGDQLFFWMNGQRILHRELPYRDFFQFTPPGADLVYFAAFKAFGPRIWLVDIMVLLLGVALCWVCFEMARKILPLGPSVFATVLFLVLIYSRLLNATHHWFSVLAIMIAVVTLMAGIDFPRLTAVGILLGLASFFTQTHALAALLAAVLFLKYGTARETRQSFWKNTSVVLAAFLLAVFCANAYFMVRVGPARLLYCQVYYVWRVMVHKPETALLGMPELRSWAGKSRLALAYEYGQLVFVYAMLPIIYVLALRRSWGKAADGALFQTRIALLAITGSALLGELAFSLNWLRLYAVSLPGIVLFIYFLDTRKNRRYIWAAVATGVLLVAVERVWTTQDRQYVLAELPAGKCAVPPTAYDKLSWVLQHTTVGEFVFEGNWPGVYIPLALRNPVFLDTAGTVLNPQWDQRAVEQLKARNVRYVFWSQRFDQLRGAAATHIAPLRSYLHQSYRNVHTFPDGEEAWEKKIATGAE